MDINKMKAGYLVIHKKQYYGGKYAIGTVSAVCHNGEKLEKCYVQWHHTPKGIPAVLCKSWKIEIYFPDGYEDFQEKIQDRIG